MELIVAQYRPVYGLCQARDGPAEPVGSRFMDRTVEEAIDRLLDIVADNVRRLMSADTRLPGRNRPKELGAAAGGGKGTIQRILRGSAKGADDPAPNAAKIDTLLRLAWYFEIPVWKLLVAQDRMSRVLDNGDGGGLEPSRDLKSARRGSIAGIRR